MSHNRKAVLVAGSWFYGSLGVALTVLGPGLEAIREDFALEYTGAGLAFATIGVGYTVGSLGGGAVSDRSGTRHSIIAGTAIAGIGMAVAGLAAALPIFLAGLVVASIGWGLAEVAVTTLIAHGHDETSARDLNLAQLGFAVGAIAAPAIVGASLAANWGWRPPVVLGGLLAASVAVAFTQIHVPALRDRVTEFQKVIQAAVAPVLLLVGLGAAAGVAFEAGLAGFFAPFLEREFGLDRPAAATLLTIFWGGGFVGRLLGAWLSTHFELPTILIWSAAASALMAVLAVLGSSAWMATVGLGLAGVASGTIIPSLLVLAVRHYPSDPGVMVGAVIAMAGVGGIAGSLGVGGAADAWSIRGGLLVIPIVMAAGVIIMVSVRALLDRQPRNETA